MKIYNYSPPKLVRITVTRYRKGIDSITLEECTLKEAETMIRGIIKENASPMVKGDKTTLQIREGIGAKHGKSKSISFYGLEPTKILRLITSHVNSLQ